MKHEITIDRREHSFSVLGRVDEMRRDKQFCDFIIKVGSEEIHAHRNILAGGSDYFHVMFSHDTEERKSGVVEMLGVDPECTTICIDHMYGRKVHVPDGKCEEMMHVADLMQLHTLRDAIASLLEEELDTKSFFVARKIASMHSCKKLEDKCKEFAEENFHAISSQQEFGELEKSFINKMIKSKNGKISEAKKLDALIKWIKFDGERRHIFVEMLQSVDLSQVPAEFRRHLIESEPLVNKDSECMVCLSLSLLDSMGVKPASLETLELSPSLHGLIIVFDTNSGHLQLFNPRANSWTKMHEMNGDMKKYNFSAITLGQNLYVFMQNKSVHRLKFSDEKANWERMADMIEEHGQFPAVVAVAGYMYVVAGYWGCSTKKIERYDPTLNEWSKVANKPQASNGSEIIAIKGNIYSFGGLRMSKTVNNAEKYDPVSSKWNVVGSMSEWKCVVGATEICEQIFLLGGQIDSGTKIRTVECYDIRSNRCTMLKPMNIPRALCRGFTVDGTVYAVGGYGTGGSIEKYDAMKNEWEIVELPQGLKLNIKESTSVAE